MTICIVHQKIELLIDMIETDNLYFDYYEIPNGWGALLVSERGVRSLVLPAPKRDVLEKRVSDIEPGCCYFASDHLDRLKTKLYQYFSGEAIAAWNIYQDLDLAGFTDFEREVFGIVYSIPYGTIWNYRQVAEAMGKPLAFRAVGNALAKNNIPVIIPCHRVIKSDHSLGGFSAGLEWKTRLLELEGVVGYAKT